MCLKREAEARGKLEAFFVFLQARNPDFAILGVSAVNRFALMAQEFLREAEWKAGVSPASPFAYKTPSNPLLRATDCLGNARNANWP
jgi:hypothetical protein